MWMELRYTLGRKVGQDYFCWLVPSEACVACVHICVCVCDEAWEEVGMQTGQPAARPELGIWSLSIGPAGIFLRLLPPPLSNICRWSGRGPFVQPDLQRVCSYGTPLLSDANMYALMS